MRITLAKAALGTVLCLAGHGIATADDTGFITIHDLRREGRFYCTASHEHVGTGTAQRTKKRAVRSAARDWSGFTAWEYGTDWARWSYARGKTVSCNGPRGSIVCTVSARPCKLLRKRVRKRRRRR